MDKNIYLNKSIDSEKVLDAVGKVKGLITKQNNRDNTRANCQNGTYNK